MTYLGFSKPATTTPPVFSRQHRLGGLATASRVYDPYITRFVARLRSNYTSSRDDPVVTQYSPDGAAEGDRTLDLSLTKDALAAEHAMTRFGLQKA